MNYIIMERGTANGSMSFSVSMGQQRKVDGSCRGFWEPPPIIYTPSPASPSSSPSTSLSFNCSTLRFSGTDSFHTCISFPRWVVISLEIRGVQVLQKQTNRLTTQLCHVLTEWSWRGHLTSLGLGSLLWKNGGSTSYF